MNASDIMTRGVITVSPETPVADVVALMLQHRISAVPVLDHDALVGIVSEGDLLRRTETETEPRRSRWLEFATSVPKLAAEYTKTHGRKASDVMTPDVISVGVDASIAEIASTLESRGIKRVPVVDGGKLVGIVSRANLLQALASRVQGAAVDRTDDRKIRETLFAELGRQKWAALPSDANILVENGVVHLWGVIQSEEERKAMIVAAEIVPGVTKVEDHMSYPMYLGI
jgi:CBS domain-containing protein